ncbi:unnamed protein product [Caenorhabditis sp. 36 PRJEB53466]|nr:unnamed protein product [Caenorhabditis sp. 36 PRJEB53466]
MSDKRLVLKKDLFYQRAERFYQLWEKGEDGLDAVNSIAVVFGSSDNPYTKSSAFHSWLLGHEIMDTVIVFLKDHIYVLGSNRKAEYFGPVTGDQFHGKVPPVSTLLRDKTDKDAANFEKLIEHIKNAGGEVGAFIKDKFSSEAVFVDSWNKALEEQDVKKTDVTLAFTHLFAVKDEKELELVRKSAQVTSNTWTAARTKYVEIIDQERRVRHSQLSSDFNGYMKDPKVQGNLARDTTDSCYDPIVMSGGNYSFKWNHDSSETHLHTQFGTIVTSFGARFADYCTNLTRTMLIFPSSDLENAYEAILATEQAVMAALKPGVKLSEVYKTGIDTLTKKNPKLLDTLNKKELGFATGIEFRESRLAISAKCEEEVKAGMVFIVYIGCDNITNKNSKGEKGKPAAIAISDTVLVKEDGENELLTEKAKSRLKSNVIRFKDEAQGRDAEKENEKNRMLGRGQRSVVLNDQTRNKTTNEEKRKERQKELGRLVNEAAQARLSKQDGGSDEKKVKKSNVSYKTAERFPQDSDISSMLIYVDRKYDSVLFPIFGVPVPFHISMIKNCSQSVEGEFTYLRINFNTPGSQIGKDNTMFPHALADYMKELTFRASNQKERDSAPPSANLSTAFRLIKEMQKRFRTEEAEEREKEGAVKQDKLILSQNKLNPKLKDLLIRPNIIQKRITGSLEAHTNGFRYNSLRGDRIDVLYNNIKHAFFQPCDNEMIILLHFHLKNPVMWGKKKYQDVQFYTEVGEITTDLGKYHHMQDRDDMQSEQQEREMRRRLNAAFNGFCEKVSRLTNDQFDFDTPFSDLGFYGVPNRSSTMLKPTSSCVVNLTEWPVFIVTLSEVELVHFERVSLQLKNFDMVFIFKDYKRKPQMVSQIPMSSIDMIKEWLHSCDIKYSEGIQSLNWAKVMKTITDDLDNFFETGGWNFLELESDNEVAEDDSDESDAYSPEEASAGSESESDEDESEGEEEESDDDDEEGSLDSDESEGKDWSDLEEEAARADNRREVEDRDGGRDRSDETEMAPATKRLKLRDGSASESSEEGAKSYARKGRNNVKIGCLSVETANRIAEKVTGYHSIDLRLPESAENDVVVTQQKLCLICMQPVDFLPTHVRDCHPETPSEMAKVMRRLSDVRYSRFCVKSHFSDRTINEKFSSVPRVDLINFLTNCGFIYLRNLKHPKKIIDFSKIYEESEVRGIPKRTADELIPLLRKPSANFREELHFSADIVSCARMMDPSVQTTLCCYLCDTIHTVRNFARHMKIHREEWNKEENNGCSLDDLTEVLKRVGAVRTALYYTAQPVKHRKLLEVCGNNSEMTAKLVGFLLDAGFVIDSEEGTEEMPSLDKPGPLEDYPIGNIEDEIHSVFSSLESSDLRSRSGSIMSDSSAASSSVSASSSRIKLRPCSTPSDETFPYCVLNAIPDHTEVEHALYSILDAMTGDSECVLNQAQFGFLLGYTTYCLVVANGSKQNVISRMTMGDYRKGKRDEASGLHCFSFSSLLTSSQRKVVEYLCADERIWRAMEIFEVARERRAREMNWTHMADDSAPFFCSYVSPASIVKDANYPMSQFLRMCGIDFLCRSSTLCSAAWSLVPKDSAKTSHQQYAITYFTLLREKERSQVQLLDGRLCDHPTYQKITSVVVSKAVRKDRIELHEKVRKKQKRYTTPERGGIPSRRRGGDHKSEKYLRSVGREVPEKSPKKKPREKEEDVAENRPVTDPELVPEIQSERSSPDSSPFRVPHYRIEMFGDKTMTCL